jgi:hypothetical protein
MRKTLISLSTLGMVAAVSVGVLGLQVSAAADDSDVIAKREDRTPGLVLAVDDDDDGTADADTNTRTRTRTGGADTGNSRSRADGTSSRVTGVSRGDDHSRGDLTKDFTDDGGDRTRDLTPNLTNDRSRNDTRA